jgi:hypothetical protein
MLISGKIRLIKAALNLQVIIVVVTLSVPALTDASASPYSFMASVP